MTDPDLGQEPAALDVRQVDDRIAVEVQQVEHHIGHRGWRAARGGAL
jgi:hypothetical protein